MRSRESRDVWAKRVQRWSDSDLTAKEFAAETGINASTLTYWKYRLGKEARGAASRQRAGDSARPSGRRASAAERTAKRRSESKAPVEFVELAPPQWHADRVEVHLRCGRRIVVPVTIAPSTLAELADSLERRA